MSEKAFTCPIELEVLKGDILEGGYEIMYITVPSPHEITNRHDFLQWFDNVDKWDLMVEHEIHTIINYDYDDFDEVFKDKLNEFHGEQRIIFKQTFDQLSKIIKSKKISKRETLQLVLDVIDAKITFATDVLKSINDSVKDTENNIEKVKIKMRNDDGYVNNHALINYLEDKKNGEDVTDFENEYLTE